MFKQIPIVISYSYIVIESHHQIAVSRCTNETSINNVTHKSPPINVHFSNYINNAGFYYKFRRVA